MGKVIRIGVLVLLVLGGLAWLLQERLVLRAMGRVVERNLLSSMLDDLPDGLHAALCGAGSPLPDPNRSGPCTAVIAGDRIFVVDAGTGSSRNLTQLRVPQGEIEAILLTHFHSDHIDGLGELMMQRWVNGTHEAPVPVMGPRGVEAVVEGFNQAYQQDHVYRVAHHGDDIVPDTGGGGLARPFDVPSEGRDVVVLDGDVKITAFSVVHAPIEPAVGYRFDYGGRSLVISGDTIRSTNLERVAEGTDLLIHEALSPELVGVLTAAARRAERPNLIKITEDILDYHTSPEDAARSAQAAGAKYLLFHHIVPPLPLAPLERIFVRGVADAYDGPFTVGRDGTFVSLPAGSGEIDVQELF
ncbi:MAG: MBL fold metallo-hydrolase [Myxococcota bacterium]|nr:MBL fold metallo-hydrolase [Myxococcota bacterium]